MSEVLKKNLTQKNAEILVEEFLKETPNLKLIKEIMQKSGLPYTGDTIQEMNTVLQMLSELKKTNPETSL
jgi:arsenate reductase-like glutaredoxin family protein